MKLINSTTGQYPYKLEDLKRDYPSTSFPDAVGYINPSDFGCAEVIVDEPPEYNTESQYIQEADYPELIEGTWRISWSVIDLEVHAQPDWDSFNLALFTNTAFVAYGVAATSANPYLVPALVERYARVASEGVDESGFSTYWGIFCGLLEISTEHREDWATLAETADLPTDFVELIRGSTV